MHSSRRRLARPVLPPRSEESMNGRVLIIEDDPVVIQSTSMVLQTVGCHVEAALGGQEGLTKAREVSPDLILLDIMMPDLDGWQVLQKLKSEDETREIPVVIFTAYEVARGREGILERGAIGLVQKPFEPEELIDIVRRNIPQSDPVS
jgi:CheY-like chemotaxis protein